MNESDQGKKKNLRLLASIGAVAITGIWSLFFFGFLIISTVWPGSIEESWFFQLIREHPGGTIGIAISVISAFTIVWVIDIFSNEPIKIELWALKFEGAAGPVILWDICFLSIVHAANVLWDKPGL